jgi:hypothetical protein
MANRPMGIEGGSGNLWPRGQGKSLESKIVTDAVAQSGLANPGENRPNGVLSWLWSLRRGHVVLVLALGAWVVLAAIGLLTWYLMTPH